MNTENRESFGSPVYRPMQLDDRSLVIRNPGATSDLSIPVKVVPELNDEQSSTNCSENLKRDIPWLKLSPAHDGVAILCGSAPSLQNYYTEIHRLQTEGARVFACNAAAKHLDTHGIAVDYQVILDGSLLTLPALFEGARCHLLASILPAPFFEKVPNPVLWHPDIKPVIEVVDGLDREFAYIGGGISVSIFALSIIHTMGYRKIVCFGLDSSFDGDSFHVGNSSPVGEFVVVVEHNGKTYRTTYDMKMQVSTFLAYERALKDAGTDIQVNGSGLLPDAWRHAVSVRDGLPRLTT